MGTKTLPTPADVSAVSEPADVQRLAEEMLQDFEAGMKQGLQQLSLKLAEEINALLAQRSPSSTSIQPSSAQACDTSPSSTTIQPSSAQAWNTTSSSTTIQPRPPQAVKRSFSYLSQESCFRDSSHETIDNLEVINAKTMKVQQARQKKKVPNSVSEMIQKVHSLEADKKQSSKRFVYRCAMSKFFTAACFLVVVANATWIGYECDHRAESESGWMKTVSLSFNIWFLLELAIRIFALRTDFIFGPDAYWNLLDVLCVLASVPDFFSSSMNVSFLRIIRLCKLSKGLRLMRVLQVITDLRMILITVFYTLGSLFWSFVAMLFVAYIFAILINQAVGIHLDNGVQFGTPTTDNFDTIWNSILALFSLITGGQDWYEVAEDLRRHGARLAEYCVMFWIFFTTFGLINVVVAVFCAQAVEAGESQRDLRLSREVENRTAKIQEIMDMFKMIDDQACGLITWEQFRAFANDAQGEAILESNGCELYALRQLWHFMVGHEDTDGEVDVSAFVMGFLRLTKESISTDILLVTQKVGRSSKELKESLQNLRKDLIEILTSTPITTI